MKFPTLKSDKPGPIEQAIQTARKAIAVHGEGQARIAALEVELNKAIETESAGAVEALEAGAAIPDGGRAASIGVQIDIMRRASEKTLARAMEAVGRIYPVAAKGKLELAAAKRAEAADRDARGDVILSGYSELMGVQYGRAIGRAQKIGSWESRFGGKADLLNEHPDDSYMVTADAQYAVPMTDKLRREAGVLEKEAAELVERKIDASADLVAALEAVIREVMPTPAAVEAAA